MKTGYFIYEKNTKNSETVLPGVNNKIRNQISIFSLYFDVKEIVLENSCFSEKIFKYLLFYKSKKWESAFMNIKDLDFLYMRKPIIEKGFLMFLDKIKTKYPKCKIIIEIPTYPYDGEMKLFKFGCLLLAKDKIYRKQLKNYVDRFAVLVDDKNIWGVPAIKFVNGVIVNSVQRRMPTILPKNRINICAVSSMQKWHGYERFIDGLHYYYANGGTKNIVCYFVGNGPESNKYRQKIKMYNLENHFVFEGIKYGRELDLIYNKCSLALGVFGGYKKRLSLTSDLKSREALAKGMPMITGCKTDVFDERLFKFFLEFPNNDTALDIEKIVEFNDYIYANDVNYVINKIRNYAFETIDMEKCLKPIIDYIIS